MKPSAEETAPALKPKPAAAGATKSGSQGTRATDVDSAEGVRLERAAAAAAQQQQAKQTAAAIKIQAIHRGNTSRRSLAEEEDGKPKRQSDGSAPAGFFKLSGPAATGGGKLSRKKESERLREEAEKSETAEAQKKSASSVFCSLKLPCCWFVIGKPGGEYTAKPERPGFRQGKTDLV